MTVYISNKIFFTKGFVKEKEITSGVIPGLMFRITKRENNIIFLENIDTKSIIVVTDDMLNSKLFIIGKI